MPAEAPEPAPVEQMECMEVWGGTEPIARQVRMSGLDAWVFSRPCGDSTCGGDVYYASSCATGRISRLLLADVAGHGAAVAELSGELRKLMRRFVNYIDQARFVAEMNRAFVDGTPDGVFATALVSTFFAPTNRLTVCNAGHPQPLWYQADHRRWSLLRQVAERPVGDVPNNMPLGILDLVEYEQTDLEMGTGDLMVFYTDALSEAHDADGRMLTEAGLLRTVQAIPGEHPAEVINAILGAVGRLNPKNLSNDDVTLLVLRPTGQRPPAPLGKRLRGLVKFAGEVVVTAVRRPAHTPLPDMKVSNVGGAVVPWLSRFWKAKP